MAIIPSTLNTGLSAEQVMEAFDNALTHVPGTSTPAMDGTGAAGTADTFSRSDHVHPSDTSKQNAISSAAPIASECVSPMTGYSKSSSSTPGAISTSDTLNAAIGKLEKRTDLNENNISTDEAALVELVDSGAKNIIEVGNAICEKNGVTATLSSNGSIILSGQAQGTANDFLIVLDLKTGSQSASYASLIPIKPGNYTLSGVSDSRVSLQVLNYNSSSDVATIEGDEFTATKAYIDFRLVVSKTADFTTPLTIYPMCCTEAARGISHAYQPYRPSYQELYERVVALEQANQ